MLGPLYTDRGTEVLSLALCIQIGSSSDLKQKRGGSLYL